MPEPSRQSPRLLAVPAALLAIAAGVLLWLWTLSGLAPQWQYIGSYVTVLLTGLGLAGWWLLLSGLPWRHRLVPLGAALLLLVLVAGLVRVRGVTGDWKPVLEWRFARTPELGAVADSGGAIADPGGAVADRIDDVDLSSPAAFPGFLGPHRDSTVTGLALATDWEATSPVKRWQRRVGAGWGGVAIAGATAFTLEQRGELETVVAYDLETGAEVWSHAERARFSNPIAGPGPRTTPAIAPDRVFTLGATGLLSALDRRTGALLWQRDVIAEHGASIPEHGKTSSPLLLGDPQNGLVVVSAGGPDGRSLVAYRRLDGALAWTGGDDRSGYASPVILTLDGAAQIVSFNAASVTGHALEDGRVLWSFPWTHEWPNVAPPLQLGPTSLLVSTGYGIGASRLEATHTGDGWKVEEAWHSPRLKAKFTNLVAYRGSVYGLDEGVLVCLDPETGERRWRAGRYGHGNLLLIGALLLVQTEKGDLVLIEPGPEELIELGRFTALPGKAWNHLALARPRHRALVVVRNDREMALWELPLRGES
ncbi:MAG TPA: PQQ-binding-like beta-propeller repeat protein [Thermoanaerobaculia bacterium]|nr:PQQ-binding-like beta-propeller repeat protein [Thermoanaerobaculia bacterium]